MTLGKEDEDLLIYDPYFCEGSTKLLLGELGFPKVHNEKQDFYDVLARGGNLDSIELTHKFHHEKGNNFIFVSAWLAFV